MSKRQKKGVEARHQLAQTLSHILTEGGEMPAGDITLRLTQGTGVTRIGVDFTHPRRISLEVAIEDAPRFLAFVGLSGNYAELAPGSH